VIPRARIANKYVMRIRAGWYAPDNRNWGPVRQTIPACAGWPVRPVGKLRRYWEEVVKTYTPVWPHVGPGGALTQIGAGVRLNS
jgi:hypothetical protein